MLMHLKSLIRSLFHSLYFQWMVLFFNDTPILRWEPVPEADKFEVIVWN